MGYSVCAKRHLLRLVGLGIVAGIAWCANAIAGPPLKTDDSETPGRRGWEVNLSHNIESTRNEFLTDSPLFDINYGPHENDQLKVEFAVFSVDPADAGNHWGISDLLVGYKYRFIEEEQVGWMASIYPQVSAPTGNERIGLGSGSTELLIPMQVGKHYFDDQVFVYAEIGYNIVFENSDANSWKYGVAVERRATEKLELMGEIGGIVFDRDAEPDDVFFNLGCKYELNQHAAFIGSSGRSFRPRHVGTPDFMSFVGVQIAW